MIILGIETSCDDTAVALVRDGRQVLGSLVASQIKLHQKTGGVVPEVASRKHLETILPLIDKLFRDTGLNKDDIDAIAITPGPGLLGALLIGLNTAKTLAYLWNKPLIPIDHLIAHVYGNFADKKIEAEFPILAIIVSGGHTELVLMKDWNEFVAVGGTRDDAAGEAFDKAAKILGLEYPGGPIISARADECKKTDKNISLPRPMLEGGGLEMSFSGLKTALSRVKDKASVNCLAFEFQEAVTDVLKVKTERAIKKYKPKMIMLAGGVAANKRLREKIKQLAQEYGLPYYSPEIKYCTDNAAMVATAAYFYRKGAKNQWYNVKVATNSILFQ